MKNKEGIPLSDERAIRADDQGRHGSTRNSLAGALSSDENTVNTVHHSKHQYQDFEPEVYG